VEAGWNVIRIPNHFCNSLCVDTNFVKPEEVSVGNGKMHLPLNLITIVRLIWFQKDY
jgi:hypothetical protein